MTVGCRNRRAWLRVSLERVMGVNEQLEPPVIRLQYFRAQLLEIALELRNVRPNGSFGMARPYLAPVQVTLVARVARNGGEYLLVIDHAHLLGEHLCCRHRPRRTQRGNALKIVIKLS